MTNIYIENELNHSEKPLKADNKVLPLNVSENKIVYPKTPSNDYEIANKKYVDDNAGGSSEFSWIVNSGFNYSSSAGTLIYLPLNGYISESASSAGRNEYQVIVMPHNGYVNKVVMRSEEACGSTVVGFHKSSAGTEVPNTTAANEVTVDMSADDTAYTFSFGESASFSAGDVVAISFDPTNDANDTIGTVVFTLDGST